MSFSCYLEALNKQRYFTSALHNNCGCADGGNDKGLHPKGCLPPESPTGPCFFLANLHFATAVYIEL